MRKSTQSPCSGRKNSTDRKNSAGRLGEPVGREEDSQFRAFPESVEQKFSWQGLKHADLLREDYKDWGKMGQ
jgi:hypothetical protein